MTDLERIKNVVNQLWDIIDTARSNFGEDGYKALNKAVESVQNAWWVCKNGQEDKLKNAYHTPVNNSHKPIKSFRDTSTEASSNDYGFYWEGDYIYDKDKRHWYFGDYLNGNTGIEPYSTYMQAVKETEDSVRDAFWEDEIPDPFGYAEALVDFAIETMDDPGKYIKEYEGFVGSSRKPIKSSLEDRLVPYLEEFEEGYADALSSTDEMGHNARLETFYEIFKSDYNLSDDDISKLEGAVQDIWHETEEDTEHDMGEMYGAPHGATPEEALKHFE